MTTVSYIGSFDGVEISGELPLDSFDEETQAEFLAGGVSRGAVKVDGIPLPIPVEFRLAPATGAGAAGAGAGLPPEGVPRRD